MSRLLDPKVMMAIKELSLAAKTTVEGFMSGINASSLKGEGLEFSQYRSYQPGDDLRSLDWKMFARSDRYYIRESEVDTNISINLVVDASSSMNHSDGKFTKIDYARYLCASLAYLANLQGDAVGLHVLNENQVSSMMPRQDYQHLARLYYQLEQVKPEARFIKEADFAGFHKAGAVKRGLYVVVTDMYEDEGEMFKFLDQVIAFKHEVIVFHLMSENELSMDFKNYNTFQDLETGRTIQIDQAKVRADYKKRVDAFIDETRRKMLDRKIYYRMLNTDQPLDEALRDFLNQRSKLKI